MQRLVEVVQRRARERAQRFVGRTMEVLVEGPSRTDPSRLRGRISHNKPVNFDGTADAGRAGRGRDHRRDLDDAVRRRAAAEPRRLARDPAEGPGDLRPDRGRQDGVAIAVAELLRGRGEDPVAVSLRRDPGLPGTGDAHRRGDPRGARAARAPAGRVRAEVERGVQRRAVRGAGACGDRPAAGRGAAADRGRRNRASTCAPRSRTSSCDRRCRPSCAARSSARSPRAARGAARASSTRTSPPTVHPSDRKRIARALELQRAGIDPPHGSEQLWTAELRRPTMLVGLDDRPRRARHAASTRGSTRWSPPGAAEEARARPTAGASRTARAALGFEELLAGDVEAMKRAQRAYARRQLTWMRKMPGVELIDRTGRDDARSRSRSSRLGCEARGARLG